MIITPELPRHAAAIEMLLDTAFGPDRLTKTAYRLRAGVAPIRDLCLVALGHDDVGNEVLKGTIRYWPVSIGDAGVPALLLGPIAVNPGLQGSGLGSRLIRMTLNKAAAAGHRAVLLIGDAPYYGRFGFTRALTGKMQFPGPVDLDRFLGVELVAGALDGVSGMVGRWHADGEATAGPLPIPTRALPAGGLWHALPAYAPA